MLKVTYSRPLRGAAQGLAPDRYRDVGIKANLTPDIIGQVVRIRPPTDPRGDIQTIKSAIPITSSKLGVPPNKYLFTPTGSGAPAAPTMATVAAISSGRYVPPNEQVMTTPSITVPLAPAYENMKKNDLTTQATGVRPLPDRTLAPSYTPSPDYVAQPAPTPTAPYPPSQAPCYGCRINSVDDKASTVYTTPPQPGAQPNYLDPGTLAPMYAPAPSANAGGDADTRVVTTPAKKGFPWWWLLIAGAAVGTVAVVGYRAGKHSEE